MRIGVMVYWRFKRNAPGPWQFGYTSQAGGGLVRMGRWNGDVNGGQIVDPYEVEVRDYV